MRKDQPEGYLHWDAEGVIFAVERFVEQYGRLPVAKEMTRDNGLPSRRTFESKSGVTFFEYGRRYHPKLVALSETRHRQRIADSVRERGDWTRETLIAAVRHFTEQHDRLPAEQEYTPANGLPSYATFCRIAEVAMTDYLAECCLGYADQSVPLQEADAETAEQEESFGMTMTF
jgi:hypothetical protein